MYKDSWETIVGNCDSVLFLGGNEQSTTEWLSKLLGKETIDICTTSDSKGVSGSHTTNYQRTGRELLTPDELAQLDNDKCIYNLRGLHPFLSRKAWPGTTIARPKSTLRHPKNGRQRHEANHNPGSLPGKPVPPSDGVGTDHPGEAPPVLVEDDEPPGRRASSDPEPEPELPLGI